MKSFFYLPLTLIALLSNHTFADNRQQAIEAAINKLSHSLKTEKKAINVISALPVKWRNSGLGCLQANVQHRDVITPGYQIQLKANNQRYWVHTGRNKAIICKKPLPKATLPPSFDPDV